LKKRLRAADEAAINETVGRRLGTQEQNMKFVCGLVLVAAVASVSDAAASAEKGDKDELLMLFSYRSPPSAAASR
jgi:hypothetical protein